MKNAAKAVGPAARVTKLQEELGLGSGATMPSILDRVATVEGAVFGETKEGSLIKRLDACEENGLSEIATGTPIFRIGKLEEYLGIEAPEPKPEQAAESRGTAGGGAAPVGSAAGVTEQE